MDARRYFDEVALGMLERLKSEPKDRGLIIATAVAVYHVVDWIAGETDNSVSAIRNNIKDQFPDFEYLDAVANTHKHRFRNRGKFKGSTDPLTKRAKLPVLAGGRLVLADGKLVISDKAPRYEFTGGETRDPLELISGSVQAIEQAYFTS